MLKKTVGQTAEEIGKEAAGKAANKAKNDLHSGHRLRMKERILRYGLDNLADHEVLEVLLYFTLPRVDTNALAHRLLNHFGSLSTVLGADYDELRAVPGVGDNTAFMLTMLPGLLGRIERDKNRERPVFGGTEAFVEYVCRLFAGETTETAYLLCLNANLQLLNAVRLGQGDIGSVTLSVGGIVQTALRHKARNVVLAHNHPGGRMKVSVEDFEFTRRCMQALAAVNVRLVDHLVISGGRYCSFAERKYMNILQQNDK